jgi:hypothetical protein
MFFDVDNGVVIVHEKDKVQVEETNSKRRFWNNAKNSFFLEKFENKYWEFVRRP